MKRPNLKKKRVQSIHQKNAACEYDTGKEDSADEVFHAPALSVSSCCRRAPILTSVSPRLKRNSPIYRSDTLIARFAIPMLNPRMFDVV